MRGAISCGHGPDWARGIPALHLAKTWRAMSAWSEGGGSHRCDASRNGEPRRSCAPGCPARRVAGCGPSDKSVRALFPNHPWRQRA
jgi:hypothetical protein